MDVQLFTVVYQETKVTAANRVEEGPAGLEDKEMQRNYKKKDLKVLHFVVTEDNFVGFANVLI